MDSLVATIKNLIISVRLRLRMKMIPLSIYLIILAYLKPSSLNNLKNY